MTYLDWYDHALLDDFNKFWFGNDYDVLEERDDKINKEALRILKYDTLGFYVINGSKEKKDHKKIFEEIVDNDWVGTKSDNLALLLKALDAYYQEKEKI